MKVQEKIGSTGRKLNTDFVFKSIKSLADVSLEEKKRQANRPLYLVRYE